MTNSLQRQQEQAEERMRQEGKAPEGRALSRVGGEFKDTDPLWKKADDRFFWNKWLCKDMIEMTMLGGKENDVSRAMSLVPMA